MQFLVLGCDSYKGLTNKRHKYLCFYKKLINFMPKANYEGIFWLNGQIAFSTRLFGFKLQAYMVERTA